MARFTAKLVQYSHIDMEQQLHVETVIWHILWPKFYETCLR